MILMDDITKMLSQANESSLDHSYEFSTEYDEALLSYIRAVYEAVKCDDPKGEFDITLEATLDMSKLAVEWFCSFSKQFTNHTDTNLKNMYKCIALYDHKINKANKLKHIPYDTSFEMVGYNYTIPIGTVDLTPFFDVMYQTEKAINMVCNAASYNVRGIVNQANSLIGGTEILNTYRGKLINQVFVTSEDWKEQLEAFFRSGKTSPEKIKIDKNYIDSLSRIVGTYQKIAKNCKAEKEMIEANIQRIIEYINTQPVILADHKSIVIAQSTSKSYNLPGSDYNGKIFFDRDEKYSALATIFAKANGVLKNIQILLDQFLNTKIRAINESIMFYTKCIDAVLKQKVHEEYSPMDYVDYAMEQFDLMETDYSDTVLDLAVAELYALGDAWKAKACVLEAPGVDIGANKAPITQRRTTGIFGTLKEFLRKILNYIGNVLSKFNEELGNILKTDVQWIAENAHYIKDCPVDVLNTMTLTYPNYLHTGAIKRIASSKLPMQGNLQTIAMDIGNTAAQAKQSGNNQFDAALACYHKYFPELARMNPNDWKEAATRWYRGGQNAKFIPPQRSRPGLAETVTVKGPQCADILNQMLEYCLNYQNYARSATQTVNEIKNAITRQDNVLNRLQQERGRMRSVQDSYNIYYSFLEEDYIENTEFGRMLVFEGPGDITASAQTPASGMATRHDLQYTQQPAQQQAPRQNFQQKFQQYRQQVNQNNKQQDPNVQRNDTQQHVSRSLIEAYRVCTAIATAKLTVCEEIYKAYSKTIHGVVEGIQKYKGISAERQGNEQYNQNQENEREQQHQDKLIETARRNRERRARRTGLLGAMKNIIGG